MPFLQRYSLWLALPVGAALSLAFAPFQLWPLAVLCPAFLFLVWRDVTPKRAALLGFLFTFGLFVAGTYWLYHSIYVIGQAPLALALFLMLTLAAIMGAYSALLGYIQSRWFPKEGYARNLLMMPATWALIEWLRGWLFSGFPWLAIGYTAIDTPLAAFAPLIGVYGLSWVLAVMAGALASIVSSFAQRPAYSLQPTAYSLLLLPWLLAYPLWRHDWTLPVNEPISVAIVQGAVGQEMKWSQEQHDATLKLYHDLTVPRWGTQLIVWPESALPDWAESLTQYLSGLWQEANVHHSDLVIGQIHLDEKGNAYNGVLALSDKTQWYNKRHLVPYGEYFPVPNFIREWMRSMSLPYSDFTPGAEEQPALHAAGEKLGVSVCYEDAYASSQLGVLNEATVLVNVTNDAWFGDTTARHQHLQIARMRALEAGRPLLRAANDGISGIIDSHGTVVNQLPSFKSAVLTGIIQPRTGLTLYARVGNWLVVIACLVIVAIGFWLTRRATRRAFSTTISA
jgi:apolipoprotein N-acyltransferase